MENVIIISIHVHKSLSFLKVSLRWISRIGNKKYRDQLFRKILVLSDCFSEIFYQFVVPSSALFISASDFVCMYLCVSVSMYVIVVVANMIG